MSKYIYIYEPMTAVHLINDKSTTPLPLLIRVSYVRGLLKFCALHAYRGYEIIAHLHLLE